MNILSEYTIEIDDEQEVETVGEDDGDGSVTP